LILNIKQWSKVAVKGNCVSFIGTGFKSGKGFFEIFHKINFSGEGIDLIKPAI
jgi:hypothetical protein